MKQENVRLMKSKVDFHLSASISSLDQSRRMMTMRVKGVLSCSTFNAIYR